MDEPPFPPLLPNTSLLDDEVDSPSSPVRTSFPGCGREWLGDEGPWWKMMHA